MGTLVVVLAAVAVQMVHLVLLTHPSSIKESLGKLAAAAVIAGAGTVDLGTGSASVAADMGAEKLYGWSEMCW